MPLVLATGAATESGHNYADVMGTSYEFPRRYRNLIRPGELFVYYRGRRKLGGGQQLQVYLGCGTVGTVTGSGDGPYTCDVEDYSAFPEAIFFKSPQGDYLEPGGARIGFFQPGVRRITDDAYRSIVGKGLAVGDKRRDEPIVAGDIPLPAYASAEDARRVEQISRRAVVDMLTARPEVTRVEQMPINNPGFDLLADTASGPMFVEVKGTRGAIPRFFLSEGERVFAERTVDHYLLVVVAAVNLSDESHGQMHAVSSVPDRTSAALREHQWRGELPLGLS